VRARAELIAAAPLGPGGAVRLLRRRDASPVAWRPTPDAVYLVGSAATPVGDDTVEITVAAEPGACLVVRSAAATVAWRSRGTRQRIRARVAQDAALDWWVEPMIATAGCDHRQHVTVDLHGTARLRWTEEILLGRHGEEPGALDLRLDVDLDGLPVLRHQMSVHPGEPWDGPAVLGPHRHMGVVVEVGYKPRPSRASGPGWARMPLDGPGTLILALAADLPALRSALRAAGRPAGDS
jgi:urease accessory protein